MDGYTHTFEEVSIKDKQKQEKFQELGITVLRFRDEDVMENIEGVLCMIRKYIEGYEQGKREHTPNPS